MSEEQRGEDDRCGDCGCLYLEHRRRPIGAACSCRRCSRWLPLITDPDSITQFLRLVDDFSWVDGGMTALEVRGLKHEISRLRDIPESRGSFNVNADRPSQSSRLEPSVRDEYLGLTSLDLPVPEEAD